MRSYYEDTGSKRLAAGALLLFSCGAAGFLYLHLHTPPYNPNNDYINGVPIGSCPSRNLGEFTVFYCSGENGATAAVRTAALTNHGPFAAAENVLDSHANDLATLSTVAGGIGIGLGISGYIVARRGDDYEPRHAYPEEEDTAPQDEAGVAGEFVEHPDIGQIPLMSYGEDWPTAL